MKKGKRKRNKLESSRYLLQLVLASVHELTTVNVLATICGLWNIVEKFEHFSRNRPTYYNEN